MGQVGNKCACKRTYVHVHFHMHVTFYISLLYFAASFNGFCAAINSGTFKYIYYLDTRCHGIGQARRIVLFWYLSNDDPVAQIHGRLRISWCLHNYLCLCSYTCGQVKTHEIFKLVGPESFWHSGNRQHCDWYNSNGLHTHTTHKQKETNRDTQ